MSENGEHEENDLAHILEAKHHHTEEEFKETMKEALSQMREESEVHAEEIAKLKEKQVRFTSEYFTRCVLGGRCMQIANLYDAGESYS